MNLSGIRERDPRCRRSERDLISTQSARRYNESADPEGCMFGSTIDYWLLLPFTHNRNSATEEELNIMAPQVWNCNVVAAVRRIEKLQTRLQGQFPIRTDFRYLDIGCGSGDIAIGLARLGACHVTGIDMVPRCISAAITNIERLQLHDRVKFVCEDIHNWIPDQRFDVVLSHEALEHVEDPRAFLQILRQFVKPHGIAVLAFGYLFHSPLGDHMDPFFRIPIPWRGVLFSEKAILRLRRKQFRPTDKAASYRDISGGLNLLRYSEFLKYAADAGWKFDYLVVNPQLKTFLPLYWLSNTLLRLPWLRDYLACSVYAVLSPV